MSGVRVTIIIDAAFVLLYKLWGFPKKGMRVLNSFIQRFKFSDFILISTLLVVSLEKISFKF